MIAEIRKSIPKGEIYAPPSKSMAHRMLICAGLAQGESVIHNISDSDDILATLGCLSALGATYVREGSSVRICGTDVTRARSTKKLFCNESGSTLRFFVPLCLMSGESFTLMGSDTLFSRPLGVYEKICADQGLTFQRYNSSLTVAGELSSGEYRVEGNISSQFISGLLFVLPLCRHDSRISIIPPIESRSYLNLTIETLSLFGVDVRWQDDKTLYIKGGQHYTPAELVVEGDYSNSAFFDALNLFGGDVKVNALNPNSLQGDRAYSEYFEMLTRGTPTIHIGNCPDLGPILMAVAAAKNGAVFCGTRRLKIKESDRGAAMAQELAKFGAKVTVNEDSIAVFPQGLRTPSETLYGHNDHRIVMSLSTLLVFTGGKIDGAEAVRKSLPEYFDILKSIGVDVTLS
ncbi:MAG: 3-phosphoshikimate 1-carboxyvinyltransferase [Eubacteriales bacterium]|nr:3-phosphoshikimate 1-carboxyvinyltransferase [Eubacteriales bacterium]